MYFVPRNQVIWTLRSDETQTSLLEIPVDFMVRLNWATSLSTGRLMRLSQRVGLWALFSTKKYLFHKGIRTPDRSASRPVPISSTEPGIPRPLNKHTLFQIQVSGYPQAVSLHEYWRPITQPSPSHLWARGWRGSYPPVPCVTSMQLLFSTY
jgi:hypothetical protein